MTFHKAAQHVLCAAGEAGIKPQAGTREPTGSPDLISAQPASGEHCLRQGGGSLLPYAPASELHMLSCEAASAGCSNHTLCRPHAAHASDIARRPSSSSGGSAITICHSCRAAAYKAVATCTCEETSAAAAAAAAAAATAAAPAGTG